MKYSCRLFYVLAVAAVLATSTATPAQSSNPTVASAAPAQSPNTPVASALTESSGTPATDSPRSANSPKKVNTSNPPVTKSQPGNTLTPRNADVEHIRHHLRLSRFHFALLLFLCGACCGGVVLTLLSCAFQSRSASRATKDAQIAASRASARKMQEMEGELKKAIALYLKTDNFSEASCGTAAKTNRESLLAKHGEIEAREAERIVDEKTRAARYENVAAYAAARSELGHAAIVDILHKADVWEYRVLQEAKKRAVEVSQ